MKTNDMAELLRIFRDLVGDLSDALREAGRSHEIGSSFDITHLEGLYQEAVRMSEEYQFRDWALDRAAQRLDRHYRFTGALDLEDLETLMAPNGYCPADESEEVLADSAAG